jgi:hypothetical protein
MCGKPWLALVPAALLAASAAAPARLQTSHRAGGLLPLSAADESHAEAGCTCTFIFGRGRHPADLLQLSGHILLSRTRAGLAICPIGEAQFQAIAGPGGSARCAGRLITVRSAPPRALGNDSSAADATVALRQGGRTLLLRGTWACSC